jgi:hypothetical protein
MDVLHQLQKQQLLLWTALQALPKSCLTFLPKLHKLLLLQQRHGWQTMRLLLQLLRCLHQLLAMPLMLLQAKILLFRSCL